MTERDERITTKMFQSVKKYTEYDFRKMSYCDLQEDLCQMKYKN